MVRVPCSDERPGILVVRAQVEFAGLLDLSSGTMGATADPFVRELIEPALDHLEHEPRPSRLGSSRGH